MYSRGPWPVESASKRGEGERERKREVPFERSGELSPVDPGEIEDRNSFSFGGWNPCAARSRRLSFHE